MKCLKSFIQGSVAVSLLALSTLASALEMKPFNAADFAAMQQQGKPAVVHFHADWCSTCVKQTKTLDSLKTDPQLKGITVLVANYDKEKELRSAMKIRSQSAMVVFKGPQEVTRLAGKTSADDIKTELLKAL